MSKEQVPADRILLSREMVIQIFRSETALETRLARLSTDQGGQIGLWEGDPPIRLFADRIKGKDDRMETRFSLSPRAASGYKFLADIKWPDNVRPNKPKVVIVKKKK